MEEVDEVASDTNREDPAPVKAKPDVHISIWGGKGCDCSNCMALGRSWIVDR